VSRKVSLDAAVRARFGVPWGRARRWIARGKVAVDGEVCTEPTAHVDEGAELVLTMNAPDPSKRRTPLEEDRVLYVDTHLVVVNKPAGVSTVPYDEEERDTLDQRVRDWLARLERRSGARGGVRPALGVVHRIDKETSGVVVFTRTWLAKRALAQAFRAHALLRRYLAIAHGDVQTRVFRSHLVEDRGDGLRGSREAAPPSRRARLGEGQLAVTRVERVEGLRGATLVRAELETGRTHQIRIHLAEAGHPLVGERVYVKGYGGARIAAPRLMLHAEVLGFVHPVSGKSMRWEVEMPADMRGALKRLRGDQG
jgi:23S rRNA pseudouridine1911/1915/1917 synthase